MIDHIQLYKAYNGTKKIRGAATKEALFEELMSDSEGLTVKDKSKFGILGLNNKNSTELVSVMSLLWSFLSSVKNTCHSQELCVLTGFMTTHH